MLPSFDNTEIAFRYKSNAALKQARFLFSSIGSPLITKVGASLAKFSLALNLPISGIIKSTIFKQFCGGETMQEAGETAEMLNPYGVGIVLDYGVEGKEGEVLYDNAVPEFLRAIDYAATKKNIPFISVKVTGFSRHALMEKINSKATLTTEENEEWQRVENRIDQICKRAAEKKVKVSIDAEESWIQDPIDDLINKMMSKYNKETAIVYNTFQLYLHSRLPYLKKSFELAQQGSYILGAKLVRGAYMEKERNRAVQYNYPSPVNADKASTDNDYNNAVLFCLQNLSGLEVFIGTHNEESCMKAVKYMSENNIEPHNPKVLFSQLFGMSDNISFNLADKGYHVAKYLPYGPVKDVLPYLIRRAEENTSVAGQTGRELMLINTELRRRKLN